MEDILKLKQKKIAMLHIMKLDFVQVLEKPHVTILVYYEINILIILSPSWQV